MKKLIALLLALLMVFSLVACGAKEEAPAAPAEEEKVEAPAEEKEEAPTTKVCPYCCSEIDIKATRCPHSCVATAPKNKRSAAGGSVMTR